MKHSLRLISCLVGWLYAWIGTPLQAEAPPTWQITPSDFQYSMTITAQIKINASISDDPNDIVGIFVGTELRGVGNPSVESTAGERLAFVQAYSNSPSGEIITFRIYDASEDNIVAVITMLAFQSDISVGSVASPYLITDNYGPTDIILSSQQIDENLPTMSDIGTLSALDQDADETFIFTLITGEGSDDNNSFTISSSSLQATDRLNYEAQSSYSVRIRATDTKGEFIEEVFSLQVNDINDPPTRVLLSNNAFEENSPLGTQIATLSAEDEDINPSNYTFTLVTGSGDTENAAFLIDQDRLLLNADIDYESKNSYSIRIRATDNSNLSHTEVLSIAITDVNEVPVALSQGVFSVSEQTVSGSELATLSAVDPDLNDTHSFRLVNETATFGVSNNKLLLLGTLDFETRNIYFLNIEITDAAGLGLTSQLVLNVSDDNDSPTNIIFRPENIDEGISIGGLVGILEAQDEDTDATFSYSFSLGTGSKDNASFSITNNEVQTARELDFETKSEYTFRVRATDVDNPTSFVEQTFTINLRNLNEDPTAITLSSNSVAENRPPGTSVGQITVSDPDLNERHTIILAAGGGDMDNSRFLIDGEFLTTREVLDYESSPTQSIRIRVVDLGGLSYEQSFTINIQDNVEAATNFEISANFLEEDSPIGTEIGRFSLSGSSTLSAPITYSLPNVIDRTNFRIDGDRLLSEEILDYEDQIFHTILVRAQDAVNNTIMQEFVIVVVDGNEVPTDIALSSTTFDENLSIDTPIGLLTTTDPDVGDTFSYTLVEGEGSDDNMQFIISSNKLRNRVSFNYEIKNSYSVRIRSTDPSGNTFERSFTIMIQDVNEDPTNIFFTPEALPENQPRGTRVGTFSAEDPDENDIFAYSMVTGAGSMHNAHFFMVGDEVFAALVFDYEETPMLSIRVQVSDKDNLSFQRTITVQLKDVNDPHTNLEISKNTLAENSVIDTEIGTLSVKDPDNSPIIYRIKESSFPDAFRIEENKLLTNRVFDFEQQSFYLIKISATDQNDNSISENFQINITNENDPPTDIQISREEIEENSPESTIVGRFSLVDEDGGSSSEYTYSLISGEGGEDNSDFQITDTNMLSTTASLNHEEKATRNIHIRVTGNSAEIARKFTIRVNNVNDPPTRVIFSQTTLRENQPPGTLIAQLSCEDEDAAEDCSYRIQGDISTITLFDIEDGNLYTNATFNYENQDEYTFSIQATDRGGEKISTPITLRIEDDNDPPELQPSALRVPENSPKDTFVGKVSVTNMETTQTITYQLYFSANSEVTNNNFYIDAASGNIYVRTPSELDHEKSSTQQIEVKATDNGTPPRSHRRVYTVDIEDVAENLLPAPLAISPNGDGLNDYWVIDNVHLYSGMDLTIFSELGQVIYTTTNYQNDWNGTFRDNPLPRGVYYYILKSTNDNTSYRGTISIIK